MPLSGLGQLPSEIIVCIGNRPPLEKYENLHTILPLAAGDITSITEQTGNHWRKIFNIFAKLMFELDGSDETTWQRYRDNLLLQPGSNSCLLFSNPQHLPTLTNSIVLVSGKQYADQLGILKNCESLESGFYLDTGTSTIVTPYFDYRQLSNAKLSYLAGLIKQIKIF